MFERFPLGSRASRWVLAALVVALSLSGQLLFRTYVPAKASLAGANGLSASLAMVHGLGMTISRSEGLAIKQADPSVDVRTLFSADDDRLPLIEPLPGMVIVYYLIGLTGIALSLNVITTINMIVAAACTALLADELGRRRPLAGVLTGIVLAGFVPLYRLSVTVGYDIFEFVFVLLAVVCMLRFERTGARRWIYINGVILGMGLWIRSYFVLYVLAQGVVLTILLARHGSSRRILVGWGIPLVVLVATMIVVRDSGSTGTAITRGGFWHSFWMGVGQFENDQVGGFTDWDACDLAHELGYQPTCDRDYGDPDLPYLFQYRLDYNKVLGEQARAWIPEHIPRLGLNTLIRLSWMAVPGLMDSSRVEGRPLLRTFLVLVSVLLLFLALFGLATGDNDVRNDQMILLGTYLALVPLTPYYLIAKVVTVSYFAILALAMTGAVGVCDLMRRQAGAGD